MLRPCKVVLTGGEPLLRQDILELLRMLRDADPEHAVVRCINTNGHLVTAELGRQLVGLADEVRVSLDALAERNDAMRGSGNFEAACRAFEHLQAAGFEPKVLVTLTSETVRDIEPLVEMLLEKGITRINLNPFRPIGRGAAHANWGVDADLAAQAVTRAWRRRFPDGRSAHKDAKAERNPNCGVGSFLNIMPDGRVYPCHVLVDSQFYCGDVRSESLLDICEKEGLLGNLARLNLRKVAADRPELRELALPGTCLGEVYARNKPVERLGLVE
jgi:MoaA/NifB/PqqE/SkfB family radical SAM enzyme